MSIEVKAIPAKPKCRLCLTNDADQTGSHITSAFLLASQIGKRGQEKGYIIDTDPNHDYSENKGDREVKEDYILCRDCERRISFVENIYSAEITNKIEDPKFTENFPISSLRNIRYISCVRINPIAFHLLIYTILWRASISSNQIYMNFKLDDTTEEDLRFTIDLFLPNTIKHKIIQTRNEWENMIENCQELFSYFLYYILKAEKIEGKSRNYEFFDNISSDPYQIMLNEYILLPFFNRLTHADDFLQVKKFTDPIILNNNYRAPDIILISNENFLAIIEMIRALAVEQRIKRIERECIIQLIKNGEQVVPEKLKAMVSQRISQIKPQIG